MVYCEEDALVFDNFIGMLHVCGGIVVSLWSCTGDENDVRRGYHHQRRWSDADDSRISASSIVPIGIRVERGTCLEVDLQIPVEIVVECGAPAFASGRRQLRQIERRADSHIAA